MKWRQSRWAQAVLAWAVSRRGSRRPPPRYRMALRAELLEDRSVPSTITPTTFADGGSGSGSLRDAVLQFNADSGTDDDTILLEAGTYALTIRNSGGRHETAGLTGDLNVTSASHRWIIQGAGSGTIIDASQLQDRVFQIVNPGTQVIFQDLVIQAGLAQDNGADGALAGTTDALGGGVLNNGGAVTLDNVVMRNNVARGGDGAALTVPGHNANGGGIYSTGGALTLAGATLANNQASGGRGGNHNGQYAGVGGSASGGGLYATGASLDISDSMVTSNGGNGGRGGDGYLTTGFTSSGHTYMYYTAGGPGGTGTGGGLYVNGGSLTIASSAITTNRAYGGSGGLGGSNGFGQAGGLYNLGTLTVNDSTLSGNSADYGGGIDNSGTLTLTGSTLSGNSASTGGGMYIYSGMVTVMGTTVSGNSAGYGGGIYNSGTLTLAGSTLSGNRAYEGAGTYNGYLATLTVTGSTLSGNSAMSSVYGGGGIYNGGTLTVSNSTLSGNTAYDSPGGGISSFGTLTVSNSTLFDNHAYSSSGGGGIYIYSGMVTVSNSTLSGNSAPSGGGITNYGTLTVSNSTLFGNSAYFIYGGGIYNDGTLTVSNSTLSGNTAAIEGGGICTFGTRPVTLTNVTFTANRVNNTNFRGGGLFAFEGSPVLHNTLIAHNFRGATGMTRDDVNGPLDSSGDYNLIGDGTGMTGLSDGVNGNLVGSADAPIDPLLGPLQDNGGPTLTHALLSGSPAIDSGNNGYATEWDQRGPGFPRIVGIIDPDNPIIDIGAFEVQNGGGGPGRVSRPGVTPLSLHVATLINTRPSEPVSVMRNEPDLRMVDIFFAHDSVSQSLVLVRRPEVGDAFPFVHTHKGRTQDLTQVDALDLFGAFVPD